MDQIDQNDIIQYRSLFRAREDMYAKFWIYTSQSKSGFAPIYKLNNTFPFDDLILTSHLLGKETIGVYPLLSDNTTHFLAIDFDKQSWLKECLLLQEAAYRHNLPCYLERSKSGNGGHVWFFFSTNIPAWKARRMGKYLLEKAGITNRKSFDRMFPSQDEHHGKGLGNLIVLPLQGKYLEKGNTAFIDQNANAYENQWGYLNNIIKIPLAQIDSLFTTVTVSYPVTPKTLNNQPEVKSVVTEIKVDEQEIVVKTTSSPEAKLVISNQIFISDTFLPDKLYKFLKEKLNFANPQYVEMQRRGYSTWNTPRWIKNIEATNNGVLIPAGFLSEIQSFASQNSLELHIEDKQILTKPITFKTRITLKPEQQHISKDLLKHNRIILEAKPAFGKTMVALDCIKRRKQKTLIIVHTRALIHQWKKRIEDWFEIDKQDVGIMGENKWTIGNKFTIASYQTLARHNLTEIKDTFGFVVIDECHHVPAHTFTKVVKGLAAKYILGLTATAYRKDKLERLMNFYIGPIMKAQSSEDTAEQKNNNTDRMVKTTLFAKRTQFTYLAQGPAEFNEICTKLITDKNRNEQIINDVITALRLGAKCLVLTERVDHCDMLLKLIRERIKGVHAGTISGSITKRKRAQLVERIRQDRFKLLIATGKVIGEGFDWPELTHLFLAFPSSWKGKLVQYVGRVQREWIGKEKAFIYDYIDYEVPILRIMYFRRLRTYRSLGLIKEKIKNSHVVQVPQDQLALF